MGLTAKGDIMKMVLSKVQWQTIGLKAGWMKISAVSYTSKKFGITFVEGGTFRISSGSTVKILKIYPEDEVMDIQYEDGKIEKRDMETLDIVSMDIATHKQQRLEREEKEKEKKRRTRVEDRRRKTWKGMGEGSMDITTDEEAFSIGYLAKHGSVSIQIPSHDSAGFDYFPPFKDKFKAISGEDLDINSKNFQISDKYTAEGKIAKYSEELSIRLPATPPEIKTRIMNSLGLTTGLNRDSLYGSREVWMLIQRGFRLGNNTSNIPKIRESMPEQFKRDFDSGTA